VHACENPQVLQAAPRAGAAGALLCFAGNPSSAGLLLLERLVASGTQVAYHGDFDWRESRSRAGCCVAVRCRGGWALPTTRRH